MIADRILPLAALLLVAAIFGFFYAWVCSTMWGLDSLEPATAIAAMQAMNASVRNALFFPAFFLTPVALLVAAIALSVRNRRDGAVWFALAALVYLIGGFGVTALYNVPLNRELALVDIAALQANNAQTGHAGDIWRSYSQSWQNWNQVRAAACAFAVLFTGFGLIRLGRPA